MKSTFEKYNPWTCLIYIVGAMIMAMVIQHPLILMIGIIIVLCVHYITDKGKSLCSNLKFYTIICLICTLINPFFSHRGATVLFYFRNQSITLEAVIYGITIGLSLFAILSLFNIYQIFITADKLMYLFSRIMPTTTLVFMLALRNIPLLRRRIIDIREVQVTQGVCIREGKVWRRSRTAMESLNTLVSWSLEEIMQTARSIRSRGYGIEAKRSAYFEYKIEKRDILCISVEIICLVLNLYIWNIGDYTIYPHLNLPFVSLRIGLSSALYAVYMSIPLWIEGWENYKWHLLK